MRINEIVSFKAPKKIYDHPEDYVKAYRHRFDKMWSRKAQDKKIKHKYSE